MLPSLLTTIFFSLSVIFAARSARVSRWPGQLAFDREDIDASFPRPFRRKQCAADPGETRVFRIRIERLDSRGRGVAA